MSALSASSFRKRLNESRKSVRRDTRQNALGLQVRYTPGYVGDVLLQRAVIIRSIKSLCAAIGEPEAGLDTALFALSYQAAHAVDGRIAMGLVTPAATLTTHLPVRSHLSGKKSARKQRAWACVRRLKRLHLWGGSRGWVWQERGLMDGFLDPPNLARQSSEKDQSIGQIASDSQIYRWPNPQISPKSNRGRHSAEQARASRGRFGPRASPPLLSPPPAPTSLSSEKILKKGPSPALPATKAPEECPTGACSSLLPTHAVRRVTREIRRAARRSAACEKRGSGRVGSAGAPPTEESACLGRSFSSWSSAAISPSSPSSAEMPSSFAEAVEQMRRKDATCSENGIAAPATSQQTDATATSASTADSRTSNASACGANADLTPSAGFDRGTTAQTAIAGDAMRVDEDSGTTASGDAVWDAEDQLPDEALLSPASLTTMAALPPMFRARHRRTLRLMALTRLREGKPAWESEEEAAAAEPAPERLSEAEARGFRDANLPSRQARGIDGIPMLDLTPQPGDELAADPLWLRQQLGHALELSRLFFRPEARGRYTRGQWRAAVGKLICRHKFQLNAVVPYLVAAVDEMAKPGAHDNRTSKYYSVARGWPAKLAVFAQAESRQAGWLRQYGGRDDWY